MRLVTSRNLYDRGTLIAKAPSLLPLATTDEPGGLVANPTDLERLGVADGDRVKVSSARGSLTLPVRPDPTVPSGTVLMRWNQGDPSPSELIDATAPVTEVRVETTS